MECDRALVCWHVGYLVVRQNASLFSNEDYFVIGHHCPITFGKFLELNSTKECRLGIFPFVILKELVSRLHGAKRHTDCRLKIGYVKS